MSFTCAHELPFICLVEVDSFVVRANGQPFFVGGHRHALNPTLSMLDRHQHPTPNNPNRPIIPPHNIHTVNNSHRPRPYLPLITHAENLDSFAVFHIPHYYLVIIACCDYMIFFGACGYSTDLALAV